MRTNALSLYAWAVVLCGTLALAGALNAHPVKAQDAAGADSATGPTDISTTPPSANDAGTGTNDPRAAAAPAVAPTSDATASTDVAAGRTAGGAAGASGDTQFSVSPVVANEKAKPRDIIKKELLVTNNTDRRMDLYITVENVDPTKGAQDFAAPSQSDLSTSLANWVEITRGVIELAPQESRKIPYLIHVNLTAKPGSYYARISFSTGPTRTVGDTSVVEDGTALLLNVEVEDDAKERLQLGNFIADSSVVFGDSASFSYLLENTGNRDLEPRGSIRIFNSKGEEVGSVPVNADGNTITPDNKEQLAAAWNAADRFGKYKAYLDLQYGDNQTASVQDTVYFWVFPWKEITAALFGVIMLGMLGTWIIHMRAIARPRRQVMVPRAPLAAAPAASFAAAYAPTPALARVRTQSGGPVVLGSRSSANPPATAVPHQSASSPHVSASSSASRPQSSAPKGTVQLAPRHHGPATAERYGNTVQLARR